MGRDKYALYKKYKRDSKWAEKHKVGASGPGAVRPLTVKQSSGFCRGVPSEIRCRRGVEETGKRSRRRSRALHGHNLKKGI